MRAPKRLKTTTLDSFIQSTVKKEANSSPKHQAKHQYYWGVCFPPTYPDAVTVEHNGCPIFNSLTQEDSKIHDEGHDGHEGHCDEDDVKDKVKCGFINFNFVDIGAALTFIKVIHFLPHNRASFQAVLDKLSGYCRRYGLVREVYIPVSTGDSCCSKNVSIPNSSWLIIRPNEKHCKHLFMNNKQQNSGQDATDMLLYLVITAKYSTRIVADILWYVHSHTL